MNVKSLKDYTDEEIVSLFLQALWEIRQSDNQYGVIKAEVSGGRVKFLTVEKPMTKL